VKYGLPADAWPTAELLARMRGTAPVATSMPAAPRAPGPTGAPKAPKATVRSQ
jgi:hypothetical protein